MSKTEQIEELTARVLVLEEGLLALQTAALAVTSSGEVPPFEIIGVDGKTIGLVENGARFSWKLTVQSRADQPLMVDARIQLVDMNSFALQEEIALGLLLEPRERQKFSGIVDLPLELEHEVMGVKGWVTLAD